MQLIKNFQIFKSFSFKCLNSLLFSSSLKWLFVLSGLICLSRTWLRVTYSPKCVLKFRFFYETGQDVKSVLHSLHGNANLAKSFKNKSVLVSLFQFFILFCFVLFSCSLQLFTSQLSCILNECVIIVSL